MMPSAIGAPPQMRNQGFWGWGLAYAGLGTSSAESVDPDVLGDDVALLVEVCVLLEL